MQFRRSFALEKHDALIESHLEKVVHIRTEGTFVFLLLCLDL